MSTDLNDLELLHTRNYDTRVYLDGDALVVLGSVRDEKPPGLYIAEDPEPLDIHHMKVMLRVEVETLTIVDASVEFAVMPHTDCPNIAGHYRGLIGLSVARGFSRKVRELFGGPRGCSHTTALLLAMGPVVVQSLWSLRAREQHQTGENMFSAMIDPEVRARRVQTNINTCHIWVEGGEHAQAAREGRMDEIPVWITDRLAKLGRDPSDWF